ncbi:FAD-dependent monooxygenase [Lachnellula occidentalis]|uniref:FAD-dependent monooxygenase n=1 Tax=Lachnellula occidentalis TaxID=215460 RepID=A0A8H8S5E4_9HELO|nr:FAD-dependent monooxygenase [Lachnellula occidentalis]
MASPSKDTRSLKICIIGAGMGGLTCALALAKDGFENIHVYETASNLGTVPGRWMAGWMRWHGMAGSMLIGERAIEGATDTELANVDLGYIEETYHYPHMVGHRHSLANGLYNGCLAQKAITFHFRTGVQRVLSFAPNPSFTAVPRPRDGGSGEPAPDPYTVTCDILLAADGIKSVARVDMLKALNHTASVIDSQQAAYRIMLTREQMECDADLLALIDAEAVTRWIGERRHIIAYPVSNKRIYNLSTTQPDVNFAAAPSETYTTQGSKSAMLEVFGDFCPLVLKMLNMVPEGEVCEWKLRIHEPLQTWIAGSVALVGDACHPTLPHMAQGAAQAIEDGAVLGAVLAQLVDASPESINKTLRVYEKIRKERAEMLVELAAASARNLHLGEGKAKEERDRMFKELREKGGKAPVPDKWADADVQKIVYGVDCVKIARENFTDMYNSI